MDQSIQPQYLNWIQGCKNIDDVERWERRLSKAYSHIPEEIITELKKQREKYHPSPTPPAE